MTNNMDNENLAISFARLEGRVLALTESIERDRTAHVDRNKDHEARIRAIEARPRAITWPEFLTTAVSLVAGTSGLVVLIQYVAGGGTL